MQFARNLAEGRGFAYNPGVPVSGSTAPLWTLLLGGAFTVARRPSGPGQGPGPGPDPGDRLARRPSRRALDGRAAGSGSLASALTALAGPMVWGALSGMEVSLAALLVTAALVLRAAGARGRGRGRARARRPSRGPRPSCCCPLFWLSGPLTVASRAHVARPGRGLRRAVGGLQPGHDRQPAARHRGGEDRGRTARRAVRACASRSPPRSLRRPGQYASRVGPLALARGRAAAAAAPARPRPGWPATGPRGARPGLRAAGAPARDGAARALPRPRLPGGPLLHPPAAAGARGGGRPLAASAAARADGAGLRRVAAARPSRWRGWSLVARSARGGLALRAGRCRTSRPCRSTWRTGSPTTRPDRPARPQRRRRHRLLLAPRDRRPDGAGHAGHPSLPPGRGEPACSATSSRPAPTT